MIRPQITEELEHDALVDAVQLEIFTTDAAFGAVTAAIGAMRGDEAAMEAATLELERCHAELRKARAALLQRLRSEAEKGARHG